MIGHGISEGSGIEAEGYNNFILNEKRGLIVEHLGLYEDLSKDKINSIEFESIGFTERFEGNERYRVDPKDMENWKNNDVELKRRVCELFHKYSSDGGLYEHVDRNCLIPEDTMRKILNGRCKITQNFLIKFTVGLSMDIETANSLFELYSNRLNPTNKLDYIVICVLKDKDNIYDLIEDVKEYCHIDLVRERASKE